MNVLYHYVNNSKKCSSTQQSKSNDCLVSLECDKSSSTVSPKKTSPTQDSKSNESTSTQECDKSISTISNNSENTTSTTK